MSSKNGTTHPSLCTPVSDIRNACAAFSRCRICSCVPSEGIGGMRQNGLNRIAWSTLIGTAIVAAACASSLRVRTDYDRTANFKQYRTFAIRDGNSSGNPVMDQRIKDDIVSAFKAKGLDEVR